MLVRVLPLSRIHVVHIAAPSVRMHQGFVAQAMGRACKAHFTYVVARRGARIVARVY